MTSTWYSSRRIAETHSGYKVLVEEGTDRILGTHILGSEASEVINLFTIAIRTGLRATGFKAHAVCVSDEWLKYDAHALKRSICKIRRGPVLSVCDEPGQLRTRP